MPAMVMVPVVMASVVVMPMVVTPVTPVMVMVAMPVPMVAPVVVPVLDGLGRVVGDAVRGLHGTRSRGCRSRQTKS